MPYFNEIDPWFLVDNATWLFDTWFVLILGPGSGSRGWKIKIFSNSVETEVPPVIIQNYFRKSCELFFIMKNVDPHYFVIPKRCSSLLCHTKTVVSCQINPCQSSAKDMLNLISACCDLKVSGKVFDQRQVIILELKNFIYKCIPKQGLE